MLFPLRASGLDFSSLRRLLPPLVFIFSCLICSCLVSSCLVLSCPVSSCLASSGLFVSCSLWSCPDGHVSSCPSFLVLPPLRLFLSCPVILLALVLSPHVLPPLVSSGLVHSGLVPAVSGSLLACCGGLLEASLGGPLGASGRPPGADFGLLDGPWSPWAAPGPVLTAPWALLGGLGAPRAPQGGPRERRPGAAKAVKRAKISPRSPPRGPKRSPQRRRRGFQEAPRARRDQDERRQDKRGHDKRRERTRRHRRYCCETAMLPNTIPQTDKRSVGNHKGLHTLPTYFM